MATTDPSANVPPEQPPLRGDAREVFVAFLRLGLTSFGGPIAHLAYFRDEFVVRRRWLGEAAYAELVSLCQFLPGPASSQVGIALGYARAGVAGALLAWLAFTLPSAVLMTAFALGLLRVDPAAGGWLAGLKVFAVAIVAQAVWGMARSLCPDAPRRAMAVAVAAVVLVAPWSQAQLGAMAAAALIGAVALRSTPGGPRGDLQLRVPRALAVAALVLFFVLLAGLPALAAGGRDDVLDLIAVFYRAGALVFGGGHVVLPLLQAEVVPNGWIGNDAFLAGYAAAQVVPGPLFTFAAFLGAVAPLPGGIVGALLALVAIFVPAFLLVLAGLPLWQGVLQRPRLRSAVAGVNAAVVGVLLAALATPVAASAIHATADALLAAAALVALRLPRVPVWAVAAACAAAGALLH